MTTETLLPTRKKTSIRPRLTRYNPPAKSRLVKEEKEKERERERKNNIVGEGSFHRVSDAL